MKSKLKRNITLKFVEDASKILLNQSQINKRKLHSSDLTMNKKILIHHC
jgi:hypothetical protein